MKRQHYNFLLTTTLATILFGLTATRLMAEPISITQELSSPITTQGQSGGNVNSNDCGFVPSKPQEVINITSRLNYMQMSVSSQGGNPTLLIEGPDGRFCILANSGNKLLYREFGCLAPIKFMWEMSKEKLINIPCVFLPSNRFEDPYQRTKIIKLKLNSFDRDVVWIIYVKVVKVDRKYC